MHGHELGPSRRWWDPDALLRQLRTPFYRPLLRPARALDDRIPPPWDCLDFRWQAAIELRGAFERRDYRPGAAVGEHARLCCRLALLALRWRSRRREQRLRWIKDLVPERAIPGLRELDIVRSLRVWEIHREWLRAGEDLGEIPSVMVLWWSFAHGVPQADLSRDFVLPLETLRRALAFHRLRAMEWDHIPPRGHFAYELFDHLEGRLPLKTADAVRLHIAACPTCDAEHQWWGAHRREILATHARHLTPRILLDVVDGEKPVGPEEQAHLDLCDWCREDLDWGVRTPRLDTIA